MLPTRLIMFAWLLIAPQAPADPPVVKIFEPAKDAKPALPPTIAVAPFQGQARAAGEALRINNNEFELLTLTGYTGAVTWDVTAPDGTTPPIKWFTPKGTSVTGYRVGQKEAGEYDVPATPTIQVYANGSGRAVIAAWGVVDGKPVKVTTQLVDANRAPLPPPKPVDPVDPPTPAPIPAPGFRVLISEERNDRTKLPASQVVIFGSEAIRDYLDAKAATDANGKKEWRIFDRNTFDRDGGNESQLWKDAMAKLKGKTQPHILISTGTGGTIEPLPKTVDATLELLKKYGG